MADSTSQLPMGMSLDADPSKGYAELHRRGHVMIDGGSCVVIGYDACQSVLRDHRRFSSEMDITTMAAGIAAEVGTNGLSAPADGDGEVVHDRLAASMGEVLSRMLPFVDPPDHSRLRSVVQRAFAPKALAQWEPRIREITGSLLDRIEPGEPFELMSGLARPLPVIVMAEMLGLDTGALDTDYWSDPAVGMMGMIGLDNGAAMFGEVIEARRRESRDDLISLMVQAEEAGQMTPEEVLSTCSLLFAAGNVTTTGLLGNAVHQLGGYPDQYHALGADPSMIPNAVEEVLRWDPPIAAIPPRRALEDAAVDGVVLPAGSGVTLFTAAANPTRPVSTIPSISTSRAETLPATSRSARESTSASARPSLASRAASRWRSCSTACPTSSWLGTAAALSTARRSSEPATAS